MREIATMRAKVVELESESDRLRRQLTNEKFERSVTWCDNKRLCNIIIDKSVHQMEVHNIMCVKQK